MSEPKKYKCGEFGYWWTVIRGFEDIEGVDYEGSIPASQLKLRSLWGAPRSVTGDFVCHNNQLKSLEHCPKTVGRHFSCNHNELTSLKYCPESVGGNFWCRCNYLKSLEHCPNRVDGCFLCDNNQLTDLRYAPQQVERSFECENNNIPDVLSEVIDSNIIAQKYVIIKDEQIIFEEMEAERRHRANIKRQLGPFAITVPGSKI